jgi:hypothetical protein
MYPLPYTPSWFSVQLVKHRDNLTFSHMGETGWRELKDWWTSCHYTRIYIRIIVSLSVINYIISLIICVYLYLFVYPWCIEVDNLTFWCFATAFFVICRCHGIRCSLVANLIALQIYCAFKILSRISSNIHPMKSVSTEAVSHIPIFTGWAFLEATWISCRFSQFVFFTKRLLGK